jgi:hypothetical protein
MGRLSSRDIARQKLTPLTVDAVRHEIGADAMRTVMTISRAEVVKFRDQATNRVESFLAMEFEEMEGCQLKCNKTQGLSFTALVEAGVLDDRVDDSTGELAGWVGVRVPLVVRETKYEGKTYEKWYACDPSDYHRLLDEYDNGTVEEVEDEIEEDRTTKKTAAKPRAAAVKKGGAKPAAKTAARKTATKKR